MRREAAAADRAREVRRAAAGWHDAGLLDADGLAEVERNFPDDRARLGPAFRLLFFLFTGVAAASMLGFVFALLGAFRNAQPDVIGWILVASGLAFTFATEIQHGPLRRRDGGSEEATALAAAGCLLAGCALLIDRFLTGTAEEEVGIPLILALGLAFGLAATWRWGAWLLGVAGVASGYLLLARLPFGRWSWFVVGLALAAASIRASSGARFAPAHRRFLEAAGVVSLLASYVAVNIYSVDERSLEFLRHFVGAPGTASPTGRGIAIAGTALLPVALLAIGVRFRQRSVLLAGALFGVLSLVTLRHYVHVAPLWAILGMAGGAAVTAALGLRRWLAAGEEGERGGFTSEPILGTDERRRKAIEMAAVAVAMAPEARDLPPQEPAGFDGSGGRSGGAGATGGF